MRLFFRREKRSFKSPEMPALRAFVSGATPEERRSFLLLFFVVCKSVTIMHIWRGCPADRFGRSSSGH